MTTAAGSTAVEVADFGYGWPYFVRAGQLYSPDVSGNYDAGGYWHPDPACYVPYYYGY